MLEALRKIETNGTPDTHARVYTIMAIRHGDMSETDRWTRHWLSVTTENSDDQHNARWHRMVYLQKLERWLDVRELCQLMLKQKPDHQGTQGALRQAVAKLKAAVEPDDQNDPAP